MGNQIMDAKITKAKLAQAVVLIKEAKKEIEGAALNGQKIAIDDHRAIKDLLLISGNDVATMDSYIGSYRKMHPSAKNFHSECLVCEELIDGFHMHSKEEVENVIK